MPEVIDWRQAGEPDEVIRRALGFLREGHTVTFPSEFGPVLVSTPSLLKSRLRPNDLVAASDLERVDAYWDVNHANQVEADFTSVELSFGERLDGLPVVWQRTGRPFPIWWPGHSALAKLLMNHGEALAVFFSRDGSVYSSSRLVVTDAGVTARAPTIVAGGPGKWHVLREGAATVHDVAERLARRILFVCTGNTCRSPLAEVIMKHRLCELLACTNDQLLARGYSIGSAGVAASDGSPATLESILAGREIGVDLSLHRSQLASVELTMRADDLIGVTRGHLLTLLSMLPAFQGSMRLLGGMAGDLPDPIGRGPSEYRECARFVRLSIDRLITEMGLV